jgi:hypothetical protein
MQQKNIIYNMIRSYTSSTHKITAAIRQVKCIFFL